MKKRFLAISLCAMILLSLPVSAAEEAWLVPQVRKDAAFDDVGPGHWCADAVSTVWQTGLMDGVAQGRFDPGGTLTYAQITAITARLNRLLQGGDAAFPAPAAGNEWYQPYADDLAAACSDELVQSLLSSLSLEADRPWRPCTRRDFVWMLAGVLPDTALAPINAVACVVDSADPSVPDFYRAGILNGLDTYGTFDGEAPLTRGAAAAMLARIVNPAQRLTFTLEPFDLCRDILGVEPETVLWTTRGTDIPAALFAEQLCLSLTQWNGAAEPAQEDAIRLWCTYAAPFAWLAEEKGISLSESQQAEIAEAARRQDGYLGLSAAYWQHTETRIRLNSTLNDLYCEADWKSGSAFYHADLDRVSQALIADAAPTAALQALDLSAVYRRLTATPFLTWNS